MKYVKLINETQLETLTNDKALNYLDENELNNAGYKEFVPAQREEGKPYRYSYEETETQIIEHVTEIIPDPVDLLKAAKEAKYNEANEKATEYLEGGNALYEVEEGKHIEATTNNISKIGLKATALLLAQDFETTFPWNTKEDENIYLNALTGKEVAEGLGAIQDEVWTVKFPGYVAQINLATTVEAVEAIVINYGLEE